jgi:hypothetical protein
MRLHQYLARHLQSLRALVGRQRLTPAGAGPLDGRRRFRPRLEALEDRTVPSISFTGIPNWLDQGPRPLTNSGSTIPPNNPDSGSIESIAVDPFNSSQIVVGTSNGGVWITNNASTSNPGAMTWTPLTDQQPSLATGTVAYSPLDTTGRTIFVGTGTFTNLNFGTGAPITGGPSVGIYRTTDGGTTWSTFAVQPGNEPRIKTVLPTNINESPGPGVQEMVLAAGIDGNGGLFRSDNNGQTFTLLSGANGLPGGQVSQVIEDPSNNNRFYAALPGSGIYRGDFNSGTGVITWTQENTNIPAGNVTSSANIQITARASGGNTVLVVGLANGVVGINATLTGVFTSTLAGNSTAANNWTSLGTPAGFNAFALGGSGFSLVTDPTNTAIFYISGLQGQIFRFNPGPMTYTNIFSAMGGTSPHADSRDVVFLGTNVLLESDDGGIFFLQNPQNAANNSWGSFIGANNQAIGDVEFHNVAFDSNSSIIFGGAQDNGVDMQQTTGNLVYSNLIGNDGGSVAVDNFTLAGANQSIRYFSFQSLGGFSRQTFNAANGNVGAAVGLIPAAGLVGFTASFVNPIELDAIAPTAAQLAAGQSTRLVIGGSGANPVYEANNAGTAANAAAVNWTAVPVGAGFGGVNASFASSPIMAYGGTLNGVANPDVLWVGSGSSVFVRTTAGGTLTVTTGAFPGSTVRAIVLDPTNDQHAFVEDSSSVFETTDQGAHWTNRTGNLSATDLRTLEYVKGAGGDVVLAGGQGGVFRMFVNTPGVWTKFGPSLPNANTYDLHYNTTRDVLLAGTLGRGAFVVQTASATLFTSNAQTAAEGAAQAFNLGSFNDSDGGGPWMVDINWGDGTQDTTFNVAVTGSLGTQNHTYGEEGVFVATVTVTDTTQGDSGAENFPVTVSDPAVVQGQAVAVNPVEGAAFTGLAVAKFTDPGGAEPNPSDPTPGIGNHYSVVSIDWGDNNPLDTTTGSLSFGGAPGSKTDPFTVSGSHLYGEEGTFTIRVVIDHEGMRTTLTSTAIVSDPPVLAQGVDVTAKECIAFQATVATFSDPGGAEPNPFDPTPGIGSHYTATVDFGDGKGASPTVITYSGAPGSKTDLFTVTATHTFDEEGTFTVTVTIDHEGIMTVAHSTATVRDNFGLLLLDPTDDKSLMVTGNGTVTVTNCGAIVVDSSDPRAIFLTGNAVVTATEADVGLGGDAVIHGQATLNLLEPEFNHEAATPDPFALPLPPAPANHVPGVQISTGAMTLSPGTYDGGIEVTGDGSVTLLPGIYYMNGGGFSVSGQGSVTDNGSGVLIVNAPTGPSDRIQFDGQASVSLAAISGLTGGLAAYNHFTIFQDPASDNTVMITGQASLTMTGVLYAPGALLKIDGDGSAVVSTDTNPTGGIVVAFDAMVTGNGALTINADPPDFAVPADAGSVSATATASAAAMLTPPSGAARAAKPIAPVAGDTDFALVQASLALNRPAAPASVIVIANLSPNGPGVLVATTTVSPAPAPAAVSILANLSGGGDTGEDGMPDAAAVPNDPQPAPMAPGTPLPDSEPSGVLRLRACDAFFAASHWAPATSGRLHGDVALPPSPLGSAGDAPPAPVASEGPEQTPSLLAAAALALGLGWWGAPRRREQELHRRPALK